MNLEQFQWSGNGGWPKLDWEMRQGGRWEVASKFIKLRKGVLMIIGWERCNHIYRLTGKRQRKVSKIEEWDICEVRCWRRMRTSADGGNKSR